MGRIERVKGSFDSLAEVGRKKGCGRCPSGCRVVCARGKEVLPDIREDDFDDFEVKFAVPNYGSFGKKRKKRMVLDDIKSEVIYKITAIDSIPCDLIGQIVVFGVDGERVSEPLKTPWPMPWVEKELSLLTVSEAFKFSDKFIKVSNPEEQDQYVMVEVQSLKE